MILLEIGNGMGIMVLVIGVYLVAHLPAIILLIVGLKRLKTKPKGAKIMLIIAGVYFLVGAGICGGMFY
jgi:hypothetical protein